MNSLFDLPDLVALDYPDDRDHLSRVLNYHRVELQELLNGKRQPYLWIRQMISWYLFRNGFSYREIGNIFHQDRTTVYHSLCVVRNYMEVYKCRRKEIEDMVRNLE